MRLSLLSAIIFTILPSKRVLDTAKARSSGNIIEMD